MHGFTAVAVSVALTVDFTGTLVAFGFDVHRDLESVHVSNEREFNTEWVRVACDEQDMYRVTFTVRRGGGGGVALPYKLVLSFPHVTHPRAPKK